MSAAVVENVVLTGGQYLGGFGFSSKSVKGNLMFVNGEVGIGGLFNKTPKKLHTFTKLVTKVVVGGESGAVSTLTNGYTVGGTDTTTLEIHITSAKGGDEIGLFTVDSSPFKVKAAIAPWLNSKGIELVES
jgi:hypothetical protein